MVNAPNTLPRSMSLWLQGHSLMILTGLILSLIFGHVWPLCAVSILSFLYGFFRNRPSWQHAGTWGGPANLITAIRTAIIIAAALLAPNIGVWPLALMLLTSAALDGLDGIVARRYQAQSLFGEYLDKESDSLFVSLGGLLLYLHYEVGLWILLPSLLRIGYVWLRRVIGTETRREPRFRWGRYIAVIIMAAIPVSLILGPDLRFWLLSIAVGLVTISFLRSYFWLFRSQLMDHQDSSDSPLTKFPTLPAWIWAILLSLTLNVLCFIPQVIFSLEPFYFLPWNGSSLEDPDWWLSRSKADTFRIWGELWLLGVVPLFFAFKRPVWNWLAAVVIPLLLVFQVYYSGSVQLYGQQPYLQNDLALMQEVLPLFLDQVLGQNWNLVTLIGIGGLLGILLIGGLSWWWVRALQRARSYQWLRIAWAGVGALVLFLSIKAMGLPEPQENHTSRWVTWSVVQSLDIPSGTSISQLPEEVNLYRSYFDEDLLEKPDVYWIFLESYGKVLADHPEMRQQYEPLMDSLQHVWESRGWHSMSQYSNAPVKGGRSWLAFTSALTGMRLENHLVYNDLITNYYDYPSITRWFRDQGYVTTRIKTMNKQEASTPKNLLLAERFYGFDYWLQNDSFPYQGFKYDVFGGIPDQYALGYGVEHSQKLSDAPLFLFMITMSGHQPWFPPAPLLPDWHDLDTIRKDPRNVPLDSIARENLYFFYEARLRDNSLKRYLDVVEYQLHVIDRFMQHEADSNSILVVIGDHQPPEHGMSWKYNFSTPVHIVSRDSSFLSSFAEADFEPGLFATPEENHPIQHETLYSLFVSRLLQHYGRNAPRLDWLRMGIELPEPEE